MQPDTYAHTHTHACMHKVNTLTHRCHTHMQLYALPTMHPSLSTEGAPRPCLIGFSRRPALPPCSPVSGKCREVGRGWAWLEGWGHEPGAQILEACSLHPLPDPPILWQFPPDFRDQVCGPAPCSPGAGPQSPGRGQQHLCLSPSLRKLCRWCPNSASLSTWRGKSPGAGWE